MIATLMIQVAIWRHADASFVLAQEDFVHACGVAHALDDVLPQKDARRVRRLGNAVWEVRDDAYQALKEEQGGVIRSLYWGTHHRDRQIARDCDRLLHEVFRCPFCAGTGLCVACQGGRAFASSCKLCGWQYECVACTGSGDLRLVYSKTSFEVGKIYRERVPFGDIEPRPKHEFD